MNLQLVTVALDPETGEFPANPLAVVQGEILSVVEHFFHHGGLPHLLLVVHHRPPQGGSKAKGGRSRNQKRVDPRDDLNPEDHGLYDKLRAWRRGRAEVDGIPVYVVCNNQHLAEIARQRPINFDALRRIEGIGEKKVQRYGRDILQLVAGETTKVGANGP